MAVFCFDIQNIQIEIYLDISLDMQNIQIYNLNA